MCSLLHSQNKLCSLKKKRNGLIIQLTKNLEVYNLQSLYILYVDCVKDIGSIRNNSNLNKLQMLKNNLKDTRIPIE